MTPKIKHLSGFYHKSDNAANIFFFVVIVECNAIKGIPKTDKLRQVGHAGCKPYYWVYSSYLGCSF